MLALWSPADDRQRDSKSSEEYSSGADTAIAAVNTAAVTRVVLDSFIMTLELNIPSRVCATSCEITKKQGALHHLS